MHSLGDVIASVHQGEEEQNEDGCGHDYLFIFMLCTEERLIFLAHPVSVVHAENELIERWVTHISFQRVELYNFRNLSPRNNLECQGRPGLFFSFSLLFLFIRFFCVEGGNEGERPLS